MGEAAPLTPLIEQYEGVKARYPGHLVLFRVGDFYETFGDDAKLLSRELEVVLTARGADSHGERLPMAGVPHHAVESYLGRLVQRGYKVALCDQVEDARLARGLVRREVTRVVTPGTVVEDRILPGPEYNFLAAVALDRGGPASFAAVDVSTGEWFDALAPGEGIEDLLTALGPFSPREVLIAPSTPEALRGPLERALRREWPNVRLEIAPEPLEPGQLPSGIRSGSADRPRLADLGARLAGYVLATQPRLLRFLERVPRLLGERRLVLDPKTLRHLEISRPMNPDDPTGPTLISLWDETATAPGRRTLAFWLRNPLADPEAIRERQDAVEALRARGGELTRVRVALARIPDLARISSRLAGRRLGPTELGALRDGLAAVRELRGLLEKDLAGPTLDRLRSALDPIPGLEELLDAALPVDAPGPERTTGRFRVGFDPEIDRLVGDEREGLAALERLEREEQAATGIRSLKIGYNQVFGHYIEISRANLAKVPERFRRRQTLSNAERFASDRLDEIESRILGARESLARLEAERWEAFLSKIEAEIPRLHRLARAVGELDALASLAWVALQRAHVRPLVDDGRLIQVREGRHPILDRTLPDRFVPNDVDLDREDRRLLVLTGPNMSGKSTYMRQVGLLVVLAQAGAYVPAKYCRVGVVDALFTRMGFTDEIGRGKSSFMVEMSEVAEILRAADDRSLVLLDEVGRGTSTFDGLALAWSTLRFLHDKVRCRTIVATHYHQLTELVGSLAAAANGHMAVRERGDEIVFLHQLVPGSTDRSYGLQVARRAGVPPELVREAERLLRELEREGVALPSPSTGKRSGARYTQAVLLPSGATARDSAVEEALRTLDPENLTPIQALAWVAEWRKRLAPRPPPPVA